jgi:hypothetical protein
MYLQRQGFNMEHALPPQSETVIDFVSTLKTATTRVEYIMENYPKSRDNDKYLYLVYLRLFTNVTALQSASFDNFAAYIMTKEVPVPETIRRVRAKIQEQGRHRGEKYTARHKAAPAVADWAVGRDAENEEN